MGDREQHGTDADLLRVAERLHEERPEPSGLVLDRVKLRAQARVKAKRPGSATYDKGALLKSRLAITLILALGIVMSAGGATLAVSGLDGSGEASEVQYSSDPGEDRRSGSSTSSDDSEVSGSSSESVEASDVEPAAQESAGGESDDDELPFTGFAAIPVLIGGLALLSSGFVLRRRSSRE